MIDLHGKTLLFGDLHLGIKNDALSRLFVDVNFIECLLKYIQAHDISNVIFLGDWFNSREFVNTITLSVGFELVSLLAKNVKQLVFILGNHDLESNSYNNVSSVIGYDSIQNVHLVKEPVEGLVNGQNALFVPWGSSNHDSQTKYKYVFGHFCLPNSIIRNNKVVVNDLDAVSEPELSINDVRTFCSCLAPGGICFSGHIHCRTEQTYRQHRIVFVGSPFEMSFGETSSTHGFYVLDAQNEIINFIDAESSFIPRHVILKISDCFDEEGNIRSLESFNHLRGNIVKKIIDKDLSSAESLKLNEIFSSQNVFEFAQAEYGALAGTSIQDDGNAVDSRETTQLASLTLDSYFDIVSKAIDEEAMKSANLTTNDLKECFMTYVSRLTEKTA